MDRDPHKFFQLLIDQIADAVAKRLEKSPAQESDMLSAKTLAKLLDCSESEIRQNIQLRRIPVVPFGSRGYRISRAEYEKRLTRWQSGGDFWD
jgi:excisionase family DNA binding protein